MSTLIFSVCLLLADYMWTFFLIGVPAISSTTLKIREMALEIVWITLWSQPVALLVMLLTKLVFHLFGPPAKPGAEFPATALQLFVYALVGGLAIGLVVWHFPRRRWGLSRTWAWGLSLIGGVLLNPASGGYALAYLFS